MWGGVRANSGKKKAKGSEKRKVDWKKYKNKKKAEELKKSSQSTKDIKTFFHNSKNIVKTSFSESSDMTRGDLDDVISNNNNCEIVGDPDSSSSSTDDACLKSLPLLLKFFKMVFFSSK